MLNIVANKNTKLSFRELYNETLENKLRQVILLINTIIAARTNVENAQIIPQCAAKSLELLREACSDIIQQLGTQEL